MKKSHNLQAVPDYLNNRRNFLKGSLLLSTGLLLNPRSTARAAAQPAATATEDALQRSKVSFTTGKDRRDMITQVLRKRE